MAFFRTYIMFALFVAVFVAPCSADVLKDARAKFEKIEKSDPNKIEELRKSLGIPKGNNAFNFVQNKFAELEAKLKREGDPKLDADGTVHGGKEDKNNDDDLLTLALLEKEGEKILNQQAEEKKAADEASKETKKDSQTDKNGALDSLSSALKEAKDSVQGALNKAGTLGKTVSDMATVNNAMEVLNKGFAAVDDLTKRATAAADADLAKFGQQEAKILTPRSQAHYETSVKQFTDANQFTDAQSQLDKQLQRVSVSLTNQTSKLRDLEQKSEVAKQLNAVAGKLADVAVAKQRVEVAKQTRLAQELGAKQEILLEQKAQFYKRAQDAEAEQLKAQVAKRDDENKSMIEEFKKDIAVGSAGLIEASSRTKEIRDTLAREAIEANDRFEGGTKDALAKAQLDSDLRAIEEKKQILSKIVAANSPAPEPPKVDNRTLTEKALQVAKNYYGVSFAESLYQNYQANKAQAAQDREILAQPGKEGDKRTLEIARSQANKADDVALLAFHKKAQEDVIQANTEIAKLKAQEQRLQTALKDSKKEPEGLSKLIQNWTGWNMQADPAKLQEQLNQNAEKVKTAQMVAERAALREGVFQSELNSNGFTSLNPSDINAKLLQKANPDLDISPEIASYKTKEERDNHIAALQQTLGKRLTPELETQLKDRLDKAKEANAGLYRFELDGYKHEARAAFGERVTDPSSLKSGTMLIQIDKDGNQKLLFRTPDGLNEVVTGSVMHVDYRAASKIDDQTGNILRKVGKDDKGFVFDTLRKEKEGEGVNYAGYKTEENGGWTASGTTREKFSYIDPKGEKQEAHVLYKDIQYKKDGTVSFNTIELPTTDAKGNRNISLGSLDPSPQVMRSQDDNKDYTYYRMPGGGQLKVGADGTTYQLDSAGFYIGPNGKRGVQAPVGTVSNGNLVIPPAARMIAGIGSSVSPQTDVPKQLPASITGNTEIRPLEKTLIPSPQPNSAPAQPPAQPKLRPTTAQGTVNESRITISPDGQDLILWAGKTTAKRYQTLTNDQGDVNYTIYQDFRPKGMSQFYAVPADGSTARRVRPANGSWQFVN